MKKNLLTLLLPALLLAVFIGGCKKNNTPPVSERIAKAWRAQTVTENGTTTYTVNGTSNTKPGYSNFRLTLTTGANGANTATLTEFDGNTFTGTWAVQNDNTLVLSGLTPQPTGTNGTISFTINEITDSRLVITRSGTSVKTGNTTNVYTLTNP